MRDMIKPSISLLIICVVVGLSLSFVNTQTKGKIAERVLIDAQAGRKEVLQNADKFEIRKDWSTKTPENKLISEVYDAFLADKKTGYVFISNPKGYAGEINITVGISIDGKVTGVKIGDNKETPGLGTKTADNLYTNQYKEKKAGSKLDLIKKKVSNDNEIQAVSGATISSRAVTSAVQASLDVANILIKEDSGKK